MRRTWILLTTLCLAFPALARADIDDASELRRMRADFLAAEQALKRRDDASFASLYAALEGYPLRPYLAAEELGRRLKSADPGHVAAFIADHPGTPYADRLQRQWLRALAQRKHWKTLIEHSPVPAPNTELECQRRIALRETGRETEAFHELQSVWLAPRSLPAACDPLFEAWTRHGGIAPELAWQRFRLAIEANQPTLARYLLRFLDEDRADSARMWLRLHARPELLESESPLEESAEGQELYTHAFRRLLTRDTERALLVWERLPGSTSPAATKLRHHLEARLATMLALRRHPAAPQRLEALDDANADDSAREWRIRAALHMEDWRAVAEHIARLPEAQRTELRWRYWLARALEAEGDHEGSRALLLELAGNRDYYGFLAADRLGLPYRLGHIPLSVEGSDAAVFAGLPGMQRARELYLLGRLTEARREWHYATQRLNEAELRIAASLAHEWGWHDRAILAIARTPERDDLELRFPLAYRNEILAAAASHGIDPALGFALIRQESAFAADARSPAGALGLMQLMPATAKRLAAQLDMPLGNSTRVLDVSTNLRLGMSYLRRMIERFGHQASALAAYNAGPGRVAGWLPRDRDMDADVWAETIPFHETRNYVQNIMYFSAIYESRLGVEDGGLAARMKEAIMPPGTRLTRTDPSLLPDA
jgi:soluble lytic murein transglycosylase